MQAAQQQMQQQQQSMRQQQARQEQLQQQAQSQMQRTQPQGSPMQQQAPVPMVDLNWQQLQTRSDYRSQYGYIITWFGGPIFWQSKKHGHVGESSAEDEYVALCHAYKCVCWLRNVFKEAGLEKYLDGPTKVLVTRASRTMESRRYDNRRQQIYRASVLQD